MPVQGRRLGHYVSNGVEYETFTCGHNQEVITIPHGGKLEDLGVFCQRCQRPICRACADRMFRTLRCDVFEKKLERSEARSRLLASVVALAALVIFGVA